MNIADIINRMNNSEAITSEELAYFETHYDAGTMPAIDPTADYLVIDLDDIEMSHEYDEMADELAWDAANFELAMEAQNAFENPPEGIGFSEQQFTEGFDDYCPTDDGSWVGR